MLKIRFRPTYFSWWWFLLAFILSYVLTYLIRFITKRLSLYDKDPHKIKDDNDKVPSFGGIGIYLAIWLVYFIKYPMHLGQGDSWYLFISSTIVLLVGMLDDLFELKPLIKSLGILLAGTCLYLNTGIRFSSTVFLDQYFDKTPPILTYLFTQLWLYGFTNAVNLLDGLDGVATGVSCISTTSLFFTNWLLSLTFRDSHLFLLGLLAVSLFGFLPHNWQPAKIYLGDTGALFIGFMYAALSVHSLKNISFYSFLVPVVIYMVPVFDTVYAALRRWLTKKPITGADSDHLHHRLLALGLEEMQVAGMMMLITAVFSVLGFLIQWLLPWRHHLLVLMGVLVVGLFIWMMYLGHKSKSNQ